VEAGEENKPITQHRGTVVHLAPNEVHDVKNPSKTKPMKAIVFSLLRQG
jgi:quercetin dioxygenase-like cupin family protein